MTSSKTAETAPAAKDSTSAAASTTDEAVEGGAPVTDEGGAAKTTTKTAAKKTAAKKAAPSSRGASAKRTSAKAAAKTSDQAEAPEAEDSAEEAEAPKASPGDRKVEESGGFVYNAAEDDAPAQQVVTAGATADPVKDYLKQIGKVALLNAAQEVELAERIEAGLYAEQKLKSDESYRDKNGRLTKAGRELTMIADDGRAAKDHLLEANLRLVVSLAKRYTGHGMLFLDLIQDGNLGLIRAVEKFDYTKGFKFSTYATWWIRQADRKSVV